MKMVKKLFVAILIGFGGLAIAAASDVELQQPPAALTAEVPEPTEIDIGASAPYYKDVTISPDGLYIAALVTNELRYNLAIFDRQDLTQAYFITDFTDVDVESYVWANNQHLVFNVDYSEQGASSLYVVARDGKQPIYTIAEGKVNEADQIVAAEIAELWPNNDDEIIIRYNRRNPEHSDYYRVRINDGKLLERIAGVPNALATWFDQDGVARLVLQKQDQGLALMHLYQQQPQLVLTSTKEPFELMPFALAAQAQHAWIYHQPQDKATGVYLYDLVQRKFVRELVQLQGQVVTNIQLDANNNQPLIAELLDGQVWLNQSEQDFSQKLQLLFPQQSIRVLSISKDSNWQTIVVGDQDTSQSYYLVDKNKRQVSLLFIADTALETSLLVGSE